MKGEGDDMNYQSMITKLLKGSITQKAASIKKLLFLYENARSRIFLYERRIVESLQLSLLIEQKDVSLNALSLLEKILVNASVQSEISNIFRKRLLSKVILNLGSVDINVRKVSHKCVHEYIRKFKDYETIVNVYLKNAIKPTGDTNIKHLKLKSINSLHSLIMAEPKPFSHQTQYSLNLIHELIFSAYQKEFIEIRRAALICLLCVLRINGSQNPLKQINSKAQSQLYQLSLQSEELSALLELIMKYNSQRLISQQSESEDTEHNNAPSPKFISIQESEVLVNSISHPQVQSFIQKIPEAQLKIFNEVSYAEQFLKKLQTSTDYQIEQVKLFAPYLEKYLVDESIKLFSISKKIVEVIFDNNGKKQFYVVLVPCVVKGIGNKRFIVRKNLDKLVRQYAKNHTEVWIENFIERFAQTNNAKLKQMLIDLFMYSYKLSPEFYYPPERAFDVFDEQIANKNSNLKWKVIDCVVLMIERQGKQSSLDQMLKTFSLDSYNKILRKLNKNTIQIQIGGNSHQSRNLSIHEIEISSPVSNYKRKTRRNRMITDQPERLKSLDKDDNISDKNVSQDKSFNINQGLFFKQKRSRKSNVQYDLKARRKTQKRSRQSFKEKEKISNQKLPQLRVKHSAHHSLSKNQTAAQSPVKKSFTQKNITYTEQENLQKFQDPSAQFQKALMTIKSHKSWMLEFDSINTLRSIVQHNSEIIGDQQLSWMVTQLLNCLNNLRSGVMKISLICLDQLIRKLKKKLYPFTETILTCILKKSVSTTEFIAEQLKKCLCICVEQLCISKIITMLQNFKEIKNSQIKLNILLIIQTMVKNQKIYKKQTQWIWTTLIDIHDQPQFQLRLQCKKVVKLILELYKGTWKNDVIQFKKYNLEKIDKILKNLNQKGQNSWLEHENMQFEKIIFSKGISSKFFATQFNKFEDIDKHHLVKKNWKDRIKNINDTFNLAFEYPQQFENNLNSKKYMAILCQHLDQKNPGLLVNALHILNKCMDFLQNMVQDFIGIISQKYIIVLDTKRVELISMYQKIMNKLYRTYDINKILKEYIKISVNSNSMKSRAEALSQLSNLLKEDDINVINKKQQKSTITSTTKAKNKQNSLKQIIVQGPTSTNNRITFIGSQTPNASSSHINVQNSLNHLHSQNAILLQPLQIKKRYNQSSLNMLVKMIQKLSLDKLCQNSNILNQKIKDLVIVCNRRFGQDFTNKINGNQKLMDFLE